MKKLFLLAFIGFASFLSGQTFQNGSNVINAGIGFGSFLYSGSVNTISVPPISLSYERGIKEGLFNEDITLGVGGLVGFNRTVIDYDAYNGYKGKWSYTLIGARGALHYEFTDNLDTYAGVMLGLNFSRVSYNIESPYFSSASSLGVFTGGYIGARYYFSDNFGVFGELGYNIAALNLGATLKF